MSVDHLASMRGEDILTREQRINTELLGTTSVLRGLLRDERSFEELPENPLLPFYNNIVDAYINFTTSVMLAQKVNKYVSLSNQKGLRTQEQYDYNANLSKSRRLNKIGLVRLIQSHKELIKLRESIADTPYNDFEGDYNENNDENFVYLRQLYLDSLIEADISPDDTNEIGGYLTDTIHEARRDPEALASKLYEEIENIKDHVRKILDSKVTVTLY